jgi:phosphate transport system substrate-binding protein
LLIKKGAAKMFKKALGLVLVLGVMLASGVIAGCSQGKLQVQDKAQGQDKSQGAVENKVMRIKGSDTMVLLFQALAEEFMQLNPTTQLAVKGGGSGTGISALIDGTTDIAIASRKMQDKELDEARSKGIEPKECEVALDALAIVVNPQNPVTTLNLAQLKEIFTGKEKNWKAVGGKAEPIIPVSRESNSGTYVYFKEHVLENQEYSPEARLMPTSQAIIEDIAKTPGAIGYVGMAYANNGPVKTISVANNAQGQAYEPNEKNVLKGVYPIARPLQIYTDGEPTGVIKEFIDFILGPDGQKLVERIGYTPIRK